MIYRLRILLMLCLIFPAQVDAQEKHGHGVNERLGEVSFPVSCKAPVQAEFNRGVALLHSFAYEAAAKSFRDVAEHDPGCAMAHWGIAMTYFHQLWQPPIAADSFAAARQEIEEGLRIGAATDRERQFIRAAGLIFADSATPYETRALKYEQAMAVLASENRKDSESQVFYALALLANASPSDREHVRQKKAVDLLEPLFQSSPHHPGVAHYLIHACDNSELAPQGLPAARLYSQIAPSAPHALHMPSHIFTRLGLWEDSIASNAAARDAAHRDGDAGEELHSMDYLVYAYLQLGRDAEAAQVIEQLKAMKNLNPGDFKIAYASTAMPVRYLVERAQWAEAGAVLTPAGTPLQVTAIAIWAEGLGLARSGRASAAGKQTAELQLAELKRIEEELRAAGNAYWARQVSVMSREVMAWAAQAERRNDDGARLMREAADAEDSIEKLPVTPGPIVPAREQLGELLLEQGHPDLAAKEYRAVLSSAPGRRGAIRGLERASAKMRQN
ncbi:MAG: hypothetical protein ACRD3B_18755 [Candidatus Sulfotelmatobacter sp.]